MKRMLILAAVAALTGCAGIGTPEPGMSATKLESDFGKAADKRVHADGEVWYYYPRQPYGLAMYVARVDRTGTVIAVEQRLTDENVAKLEKGKSNADEVRDLLGPPWKVWPFPRMQRDIWEYRMALGGTASVPQGLYINISPDNVVREVYTLNDPDNRLSECCAR